MNRAVGWALLAIWMASEGDIQLARALRSLGPEAGGLGMFVHPPFWLALSLLAGHFFLWLYVLTRLELSVAVPLTASSYVFNAVLVHLRLGEQVSVRQWLGTLLITLGVVIVTRTSPPPPQ